MDVPYDAARSEVSPPTARSPIAAAAITGGDSHRTRLPAWKYTLPAFLIAFMLVLDAAGAEPLLKRSFADTVPSVATELIGIAALAGGAQDSVLRKTRRAERAAMIAGALLLVYPGPVAAMQMLRKS